MENFLFFIERLIVVLEKSTITEETYSLLLDDKTIRLARCRNKQQILERYKDHAIFEITLKNKSFLCVMDTNSLPDILYQIDVEINHVKSKHKNYGRYKKNR